MVSWSLCKPSSMMAVMARISVSAVHFRVLMRALAMYTDWCRFLFCLLIGSFFCLGLGRVCRTWVTVGGRGDRVQEGSVPVVKAQFVAIANARLSGVIPTG